MKKRTSIEKSHSVYSNFKLTLLCLLLSIFVSGIWASFIIDALFKVNILFYVLVPSGVGAIICLIVLLKFRR